MTLLGRFLEQRHANAPQESWAKGLVPTGPNTSAGQRVTQDSGSRLATAYSCVRFLADQVSALPRHTYRKQADGAVVGTPPPRWLDEANTDLSMMDFLFQSMWALNTDGNAYALIVRDENGLPSELLPVHPASVAVERNASGRPVYTVEGKERDRFQVLHVPGAMLPGALTGLSPIDYCRQTFGLGQATEEYGAAFFQNGAAPGGVIQFPAEADPSPAKLKQIAASWRRSHGGSKRAHLPGVLTGGATWQPVSIPNDQAQFLETRKLTRSEIAGIYRVPPHVVGDLEKATYSNIEHQGVELVKYTFLPWLQRLEWHLSRLLPRGQYVKFEVEGLLRGDTLSRYRSYAMGRQWGWLNVDEIRALEDLPELPDGKGQEYLVPQNMAEAGALEEPDPITGGKQNDGGISNDGD